MTNKFILHVDLNSFFASCEQQANFLLRGKPVAVCAYPELKSVILASSIEAKKLGIKTGLQVRDALKICPDTVILENDPPKYRALSQAFNSILSDYSDSLEPYSIDETFVDLTGWVKSWSQAEKIAKEIKTRVREEVGDWLTCSIGISFTSWLAKVGSDIKKPDGLTLIGPEDLPRIYEKLGLTDLWGIAQGWKARLNKIGVKTIIDLYDYPRQNLVALFGKPGATLYARIHGLETKEVYRNEDAPKSISHQYAIPKMENTPANIPKILMKLCEKVGRRLRAHNLEAGTIFVYLNYWRSGVSKQKRLPYPIRGTLEIYQNALEILQQNIKQKKLHVLSMGVSSFAAANHQLSLLGKPKSANNKIDEVMDKIKDKYGEFAITHGQMLGSDNFVPDRIGFRKTDLAA